MKRTKLSGAAYRKLANEKREREATLQKKLGTVDTFFRRKEQVISESSSKTEVEVATSSELCETQNVENIVGLVEEESALEAVSPQFVGVPDCDSESSNFVSDDPAEWCLNESTIDILLRRGINQNAENDFSKSERLIAGKTRFLNNSVFFVNL